jgi:hypothetical protein
MSLYQLTQDVVVDPALYGQRGHPLEFSWEESEFVLAVLDKDPMLYLNKIQAHIYAMSGTCHPLTTILNELRLCLKITKKVACTVRPAQCPLQ